MGELQDVAKGLEVAGSPAALEVADVRGAGDGAEVDHVVANVQMALGIARVQHEAQGRVHELRLDELAPEADHLRRFIDRGSGATIDLAGGGAADLESRLLEDPVGGLDDALDLLGGENLDRRPGNLEPRQGRERRAARAMRAPSITAAGWCRSFAHGSTLWDDGGAQPPMLHRPRCYTGRRLSARTREPPGVSERLQEFDDRLLIRLTQLLEVAGDIARLAAMAEDRFAEGERGAIVHQHGMGAHAPKGRGAQLVGARAMVLERQVLPFDLVHFLAVG